MNEVRSAVWAMSAPVGRRRCGGVTVGAGRVTAATAGARRPGRGAGLARAAGTSGGGTGNRPPGAAGSPRSGGRAADRDWSVLGRPVVVRLGAQDGRGGPMNALCGRCQKGRISTAGASFSR